MTSLPIIWGEAASVESVLSDQSSPAPIYQYWRDYYETEAVDSFERLVGSDTDIVILAQAPAMDPADIAVLDEWIRAGGRAIILTDPMLVWPSDLPIRDGARPLAIGLLSPLLDHWGIELLAPDEHDEGSFNIKTGKHIIPTAGVGNFAFLPSEGDANAKCMLSTSNVIARCELGKGKVVLVADADFLHEGLWLVDPLSENGQKSAAILFVDEIITKLLK